MLWVGPGFQWFRVWSPFGMIKTWSMLLVTVLIKLFGFGYLPWLVGGSLSGRQSCVCVTGFHSVPPYHCFLHFHYSLPKI